MPTKADAKGEYHATVIPSNPEVAKAINEAVIPSFTAKLEKTIKPSLTENLKQGAQKAAEQKPKDAPKKEEQER